MRVSDIDANELKRYINEKYSDSRRVIDIEVISIVRKSFQPNQISSESELYAEASRKGHVEVDMVKIKWDGWNILTKENTAPINHHLVGCWTYRKNRTNNCFNLSVYKNWIRNNKLDQLGINE